MDVYPLPLQSDIMSAVKGYKFILIVDVLGFFHQWQVSPDDVLKLTVVLHCGMESFKVAVMEYKNSPLYVQWQMDWLLWLFPFAWGFIDNIVIFSWTFTEHLQHLWTIFALFQQIHLSLQPMKAFLGYLSINLLGQ